MLQKLMFSDEFYQIKVMFMSDNILKPWYYLFLIL